MSPLICGVIFHLNQEQNVVEDNNLLVIVCNENYDEHSVGIMLFGYGLISFICIFNPKTSCLSSHTVLLMYIISLVSHRFTLTH